jgi:23S rRNA pseudouridine1911/1915/1917 synthase
MTQSSTPDLQSPSRDLWGPTAPIVEPDELSQWIVEEDQDLLVINKPGWLVCHPSKNGPASSLVGAVRTYLRYDKLHLVSRLDRETSGLILFAKNKPASRRYQMALQDRQVEKTYLALVEGVMQHPVEVYKPLTDDKKSPVHIQQKVVASGGESLPPAHTRFVPRVSGPAHTLCEVYPTTGRKHQIRAHAHFIGHPIVGDKLYGPDPLLYLRFIESGWTSEHAQKLAMQRQALHCSQLRFQFPDGSSRCFSAPEPDDFTQTRNMLAPGDFALAKLAQQRF